MQLPRPVIQQRINRGDPITADFLNGLVGLAGYFQGQPVDAVVPGESIFVGRPAFMEIVSTTYPSSSETQAWPAGGRVYGLNNATTNTGSTSAYAAVAYDADQYPGLCLNEINGGNFADVGDFVFAQPIQTPTGLVFLFQSVSPSSRLYRVSDPVVIIADRRWSYALIPQMVDSDGISWSDDPDGEILENAMNEAEALNSAGATLQGNDVDFSLPPFGTTAGTLARVLQSIKENRMVEVTRFTYAAGSGSGSGSPTRIPWFNAQNVVQEPCQT